MDINIHDDIMLQDFNKFISVDYCDRDLSVCFDVSKLLSTDESVSFDSFVFMFCICGEVSGDIDGSHYVLKPNDLMVCRPNRTFSGISRSDDFKCVAVRISQELLLSILPVNERLFARDAHFAKYPIVNINEEDAVSLCAYCSLLNAEAAGNKESHRREIVISLTVATVHKMLYFVDKYVGVKGKGHMKQSELLFGRFIELLSDSPLTQRTVNYYAEKLCVTPKYLSVVCRRTSGRTASEWINEFVMREIKKQLKHSSKSIKEISLDLDFPNLSFFGKYVKAHLGMSPTQYRKKLFE